MSERDSLTEQAKALQAEITTEARKLAAEHPPQPWEWYGYYEMRRERGTEYAQGYEEGWDAGQRKLVEYLQSKGEKHQYIYADATADGIAIPAREWQSLLRSLGLEGDE